MQAQLFGSLEFLDLLAGYATDPFLKLDSNSLSLLG